MNKINTFTSTGIKLAHHPDAVSLIKKHHKGSPISLQIAPTSQCNLRCEFCSNVNRKRHEHLVFSKLVNFIERLQNLGLKAVEISGGGDPTMYSEIERLITYCADMSLNVGMITNGIKLHEMGIAVLNKLTWLRISMNCLDYVDHVKIPKITGTLGFSYVWNKRTCNEVLVNLHRYVEIANPAYVRIVPNCQATVEEQRANNQRLFQEIEKWGPPYFYQVKDFRTPDNCYWGYLKPFLLHDGYVYPCSSVVLNDSANRYFNEKYRWYGMDDFPKIYDSSMKSFPTKNCTHCVFAGQNDLIDSLMNPNGMEDFI